MTTKGKRSPMMGVSIYRGNTLLGKAVDLTIDGDEVYLGLGIIDRFEVLRYLAPHVARDMIGEKSIDMPPIELYCDPSCIVYRTNKVGKKKTPNKGEASITRIIVKPHSIEVIPMPGQNLSLKSLKGKVIGSMEVGVDIPDQVVIDTPVASGATVLY